MSARYEWAGADRSGFDVALSGVQLDEPSVDPGQIAIITDTGSNGIAVTGSLADVRAMLVATVHRLELLDDWQHQRGPRPDGLITSSDE